MTIHDRRADIPATDDLKARFRPVFDRIAEGAVWLRRFGAGEIAGNGWTEGDGFRVDGEKYYSTGSLFAEWIDTYATRSDTGAR